MSEYNEESVEVLPTLGKALTIKTGRQGRERNLSVEGLDFVDRGKTPANTFRTLKTLKLTCNTIMKHKRSAQYQVDIATKLFHQIFDFEEGKKNWVDRKLITSVKTISRGLMRYN